MSVLRICLLISGSFPGLDVQKSLQISRQRLRILNAVQNTISYLDVIDRLLSTRVRSG
jgi:hypothetical protein